MNNTSSKTTLSLWQSVSNSPVFLGRCVIGVMLLFLLLSLAACASGPQSVAPIVTETQTVQIPQALTNPTEPAICRLATNGDLVDCIKAYDNQLNSCNGDKASIVEFQKEPK